MSRLQPWLDNWMGIGIRTKLEDCGKRLMQFQGRQFQFWDCSAENASGNIQVEMPFWQAPHLRVRGSRKMSLGRTQRLGPSVEVEAEVQGMF